MKKNILLAALVSLTVSVAFGETSQQKGLAIAKKADQISNGFVDQVADTKMILKNKHGQSTERLMKVKWLEVTKDGDKSLVIFQNPKDIKGTAFLSFTHKVGDDDQWLYLPALKRVKRISSNNKSGPFVGSEFAYEDISSQEVEKYTYKFIKEDSYEKKPVFLVERYPVDKNSGYTRQLVWFDKKEYIPLKIEYYDRKESHLKTLLFKDYKKYLDRHWRAHRLEMANYQNGKSTDLLWNNFKFKSGLTTRDFDKNALKRAR